MVQNIAVVGLVRKQAYEVSKILARELDMLFFDCVELFEFDNVPRNLTKMLTEFGERYYRTKEKGMLRYVSEFFNTVINLEAGMASKENFKTLKTSCLLVYVHSPLAVVKKKLEAQKYSSKKEKNFYCVSEKKILSRTEKYNKNADIVVSGSGSAAKIVAEIIRKIKELYFVK